MATSIKISQLPAKGSNLEATDLLEVSEFNGTGYVSKSITGQEIIDSVPPTSVEWGDIGGTLSAQTDLNTALSGKVPTSRTLTINGTTQDLSADRTFTISTGITIGTTAITSGTVGRVLFEGTGNVVQESANLFWDNTNGWLGIGTSSPIGTLNLVSDTNVLYQQASSANFTGKLFYAFKSGGALGAAMALYGEFSNGSVSRFGFSNNLGNTTFQIGNNGNVQIGTTTDAGFKLDVNGTARVVGNTLLDAGIIATSTATTRLQSSLNYFTHNRIGSSGALGFQISQTGTLSSFWRWNDGTDNVEIGNARNAPFCLFTNNTEKMRIVGNGNVLINTTTDDGYKLDVNGTARVVGSSYFGTGASTGGNGVGIGTTSLGTIDVNQRVVILNAGLYPGYILGTNTGGTKAFLNINGVNNNASIGTETNSAFHFFSNNTERMRIFAGGNIGINTTTDAGYKLDVNGTARVSGSLTVASGSNFVLAGSTNAFSSPSFALWGGGTGVINVSNGGYGVLSRLNFGANAVTSIPALAINTNELIVRDANNGVATSFGVGVASTMNASAKMQIDATDKGFLPPRMTTTQKNAIATPATGLQIYDTTLNRPCFYDGTSWITL